VYSSVVERERIWTAATAAALIALTIGSAWQRWQSLTVVPFPVGVDGYFYPIQLRSLLEHGTLHYPASPLTFWWMLPFAAATDPITGAKLGAAIGCALVTLPAFGVAFQLTRSRGASLLAAAIATSTATSMYLTSEYVKQGIGLTVALTAIWLLLRALAKPTRLRIGLFLAGLVAALLSHKLAAGAVLVISAPAAFQEARARGVLRGRRLLYMIVGVAVVAIVVLVVGLIAPHRFLSPTDLALFGDLFSSTAHWDAPALVRPRFELVFDHDAAIAGALAILAAAALAIRFGERDLPAEQRRTPGQRAVAWAFVALGILIALPWLAVTDAQGLGFRLRVTAFVPLALCAALVAASIAQLLDKTWHRDAALAVIAFAVTRAPHDLDEGRVRPHPAMVSAIMAATTKVPANTTLIIPERHILFMTAWYARAPVALRPEAIPYGRRVRLVPLSFIGMGSPLDAAIDAARADPHVAEPPIGLHARHRNGLVLITEATWDYVLAHVAPEYRSHWARWSTI